eukprot:TRINITY_DN3939_c0_g1_i1.p1 TRINITY_DN3939_c0_g1~~TRINITY_DN3939_c0_g1_i1.p1  ORF type:complete len:441 (+),score=135.46 TRINITY_DN3939_c0_g1_i1:37-1359(+)
MSNEPYTPGLEGGSDGSQCNSVVIHPHEPDNLNIPTTDADWRLPDHDSGQDHDPYAFQYDVHDEHSYSDAGSSVCRMPPAPPAPASPLYCREWQHRRSATAERVTTRALRVHDRSLTADLSPSGHESVNPLGRGWWLSNQQGQPIDSHILEEMIERAHNKPGDPEDPPGSPWSGNTPRISEGLMEEASRHSSASASAAAADDDDCAMCLCPLTEDVCTLNPCGHRFHTECMFEFFSKCSVKGCIICRGDVDSLVKDNGEVVGLAELKRLFKVECFGLRFRTTPFTGEEGTVSSFFTVPSHVKALTCTSTDNGQRKVKIPAVVLELVDSDGNLSTDHGDVFLSVLHSSATGTIAPDSVMFERGVAVFKELECEYKPDKTRPNLLAIKFQVEAPTAMAHHKALYAGVKTTVGWEVKRGHKICLSIIIVLIILVSVSVAVYVS